MNRDLTVGKPQKVLLNFCLPLFGSIIFQQLYNLADSIVAGKFIGENALAAVGNSYEITLILIAFAFGSNIGCSVIVSQLFGAKKYKDMKTAVYTSLIASGALCLALMAVGFIFSGDLLNLINTPDEAFADSKLYLDIYLLGLPFVFFYNISTGIFSALGDSRTPFWFLMASSLANIGMDVLFVTAFSSVFTRGVDGVAWATFICQGVSCVLAVVFVFRRLRTVKTDGKVKPFSRELLGRIASVAVPSILQQSFISVGNVIIQGVINSFGTAVMAGYAASIKLNNLVITSFTTIGNGISNFTAQNIGAEKYDRVRAGYKAGIKIILAIAIPFTVLYFTLGKYLVYLFLEEPTAEALSVGTTLLMILSPFYAAVSLKLASDGVLRGARKMALFMTDTFTDLVLRVVLALVLSVPFGATGIWISWPIGWVISAAMSVYFYFTGEWNENPKPIFKFRKKAKTS